MKKALIVEDNENNLYLISYILKSNDYEVISAPNGISGVETAINQAVDVILMDIQMPDIDGYEAIKRIREAEIETPIIAVTSYAMAGDREKALQAGADGYITKPINARTFVSEIEKHLKPQ